MEKADFLRECMLEFKSAPIDQFNEAFCRVCATRDCVRSAANQMTFDKRVHSWQDTLFLRVPRANDEDHKFGYIRGKNFIPLTPTDIPDTRVPYEVKTFAEVPIPETRPVNMSSVIPVASPVAPVIREAQEPPSLSQESSKASGEPKQVPVVISNTPYTQGTMIGSEDTIIEPGATVTFKGS